MPDVVLFPEHGLFHRAAKTLSKSAYRVLWGCVWRNPGAVPSRGPALVVSNHPSYLDPLCIYAGAPRRIHWMAWEALFRVPLMGPFIRRAGAFPVNDLIADVSALRTAARLLRDGQIVGVFPEGGRSLPGGRTLPFLAGPFRLALKIGCPVVPVTVNGAWSIWPRTDPCPRLRGGMEVIYHEPLAPEPGAERASAERADDLARRARRVILASFKAPVAALAVSSEPEVLGPDRHPVLRADREGVPLLEWVRREGNRHAAQHRQLQTEGGRSCPSRRSTGAIRRR